jgi:hypothetical protein
MSDASTDMVPRSRLNEEIAKRKELEADLTVSRAKLAEYEPKLAEVDNLRAQLAKTTSEHETFRAGVEAGITDAEGLELARYFYDKVQPAEDGTRPTFGEFMGKLKTDPAARPKALTGYFAETAPAAPAPTAAVPAAAPAKPTAPTPPRSTAPLPAPQVGATSPASPTPPIPTGAPVSLADYQANREVMLKQAAAAVSSRLGIG